MATTATPEPFTAAAVRAEKLRRAEADVVYWLSRYGWTFDTRTPGKVTAFKPYPRQAEFLRWLEQREAAAVPEEGNGDGLVEKCRDMGVTWLCVAFALHRWLFRPGTVTGFGSEKLELVDKKGDPKCIFEKLRFLFDRLPPWMKPHGFKPHVHDAEAKFLHPSNGCAITGEGGDDIGRGGRYATFFADESASIPHADRVDQSLSLATRCRIDVSTPKGVGNAFWRRRFSGKVPVFVFDWRDDPRKNRKVILPDGRTEYPWYKAQQDRFDKVTLAQEVDRDYTASVEGICVPGVWVRAAVGLDLPEGADCWAGLDVGAGEGTSTVLAVRRGPVVLPLLTLAAGNTTTNAWRARDEGERLGVQSLCYEHCGVGAGPKGTWESAEEAQRPKFDTRPVNTGAPATKKVWRDGKRSDEKFLNLRAEMWWEVRERFEKTYEHVNGIAVHPPEEMISIPDDAELVSQLSAPLAKPTANGRTKVESKKDMRTRGVRSPDRADAVVLSFFEGDPASKYEREELLVL